MRIFIFLIIAGVSATACYGQSAGERSFKFLAGVNLQVTPVYVGRSSPVRTTPKSNVFVQPDEHLSGFVPDFNYSIEMKLKNSAYLVMFSQEARRSLLYYRSGFIVRMDSLKAVRRWTTDVYIDGLRSFNLRNSKLYIGLGFALSDIGSGYDRTEEFRDANNQPYYKTRHQNFVYTSANTSFGWRKKRFYAELKMNFVWDNPNEWEEDFFLPELKLQYQLFSF